MDDELHGLFAERERGVRIMFIFGSYHSGTMIRLAEAYEETAGPRVRFH